jgi:hypothetical protein
LWHDPQGRLWLFWGQCTVLGPKPTGKEPATGLIWAMHSGNSGDPNPKWSEPRRIAAGVMLNKPTVLSSGEWLLPVARWWCEGSNQVIVSRDEGITWRILGRANVPNVRDRDCDEPMIVERSNGDLWMLVRTRYGIGESLSTDRGKTWSDVAPTTLTRTVVRFFLRRLRSGNLLFIKHTPPNNGNTRSHLTALLSENDGKTWVGGLLLDERKDVSYPDAVESPEGVLYAIYDHSRSGAKQILMATYTEKDIHAGKDLSGCLRLRVLVNQAGRKSG